MKAYQQLKFVFGFVLGAALVSGCGNGRILGAEDEAQNSKGSPSGDSSNVSGDIKEYREAFVSNAESSDPNVAEQEAQQEQKVDEQKTEGMSDQEKRDYNDQKFIDKFKTLSDEEKKKVVKKIADILKKLKEANLSQEEIKAKLKEMRPPMPSKKVLDKLLKKKPKKPASGEEGQTAA